MDKILIYEEIMKRYRNGDFGNSNLSMHDILESAGYPNLINDMTGEEFQELIDKSSGFTKLMFSNIRSKKMSSFESNIDENIPKKGRTRILNDK